jgi:acetylornithine/N-succinyldiaminopimelate aminotransferase
MVSPLRSSFLKHVAQTSDEPDGLEVKHGQGIYLFDREGKPFIDCISGIAVSSLGHGHPRILDAIRNQLDLHLHTHVYGEHVVPSQVALAMKLAELLPPSLSSVYFVNSGAEAVEGSLKLARKFTSRYEILACRNAYHGSTAGADSLRSDLDHTASSRPLVPGIKHMNFNAMEDLELITEEIAAVIIEPIQGEAGCIVAEEKFLAAIRNKCNEAGALLIFDEIQTGMGRTGKLWAFENTNVIPDVLLLAKSFGGGLPLGAFISSFEIMSVLSHPPLGHMTTFGGNALCCAASLAALNVIINEDLPGKALQHETLIRKSLEDHPAINSIRGRGLMLAIELKYKDHLHKAVKACREEGLLVDWFLFNQSSIRLAPPLVITEDEIKLICEKLRAALDSL